jgi:hypothetical protein
LTTLQSSLRDRSSAAPESWWRTTKISGRMALRVEAVSIKVSPLETDDVLTDMFKTSAPSRLPASSKLDWVRVIAPLTLMPSNIDRMGVEVFTDMRKGLKDVDIVMMLRLQLERMTGAFIPAVREYFRFYGLEREKLGFAKPGALVMHPGPMNRGVEIASDIADDPDVSVIAEQVEMGVAVRMAVLDALARGLAGTPTGTGGLS